MGLIFLEETPELSRAMTETESVAPTSILSIAIMHGHSTVDVKTPSGPVVCKLDDKGRFVNHILIFFITCDSQARVNDCYS